MANENAELRSREGRQISTSYMLRHIGMTLVNEAPHRDERHE